MNAKHVVLSCHQALGEPPWDWGPGLAPLPCLYMDININRTDLTAAGPRHVSLPLVLGVLRPLCPGWSLLVTVQCVGQSIEGRSPQGLMVPISLGNLSHPRVSSQSASSGDQVATQTLHICFRILGAEWLPNITHLEVKTPPGDQDGDTFDPLRPEQFMGRFPPKH